MYRMLVLFFTLLCLTFNCSASYFYRAFWTPTFHGDPLSWCTDNGKTCGRVPARIYCRALGYKDVSKYLKAEDVGLTRDINNHRLCHHALCDGYKMIKCKDDKVLHSEYYTYYAKKHRFAYPRYYGERVDWCYRDHKRCGRYAAYTFCRRQGYMSVRSFRKASHVGQTREIGSESRCFGKHCQGFKYIACRR